MKTHIVLLGILMFSAMACAPLLASPAPDTKPYAETLRTFVDASGMVDYKGLKSNPHALNTYLKYVATVPEQTIEQWPDRNKIAFWINTYNALTLKA
ncbi:MAG: DUF547 domain-containing protein, partial [Planctomycetes bacterium]|nr:DUF547 domain-containing protein [Planctomycetota bacterium]